MGDQNQTDNFLKSLKRSYNSSLIQALRDEFTISKESYKFGQCNTISKDWCHIIPISYLANLKLPYNILISLVTDPRNIRLADSEHNRTLGANIDYDLLNQNKVDIDSFVQDIIDNKIEPSIDSKVIYNCFMSMIEAHISNINQYRKLKDFVNNTKTKYSLPEYLYKALLEMVRIYPSLSFYLKIFNLSDSQIKDLFSANAGHMLLKYYKDFNLNKSHLDSIKEFVCKYITIPYIVRYYWFLNEFDTDYDNTFNEYLINNDINLTDVLESVRYHINNLTVDDDFIKYETFLQELNANTSEIL